MTDPRMVGEYLTPWAPLVIAVERHWVSGLGAGWWCG